MFRCLAVQYHITLLNKWPINYATDEIFTFETCAVWCTSACRHTAIEMHRNRTIERMKEKKVQINRLYDHTQTHCSRNSIWFRFNVISDRHKSISSIPRAFATHTHTHTPMWMQSIELKAEGKLKLYESENNRGTGTFELTMCHFPFTRHTLRCSVFPVSSHQSIWL